MTKKENKYQIALDNVKKAPEFMGGNEKYRGNTNSCIPFEEDIGVLQELVDNVNKLKKENKKQNKLLDILKPYILIDDTDGEYKLIISTIDYDITKEQDELFKEWLENE